jgi:hypothetical protein
VRIANGQLWTQFLSKSLSTGVKGSGMAFRTPVLYELTMIAALHRGNYATISNYLERELRYMDAGE